MIDHVSPRTSLPKPPPLPAFHDQCPYTSGSAVKKAWVESGCRWSACRPRRGPDVLHVPIGQFTESVATRTSASSIRWSPNVSEVLGIDFTRWDLTEQHDRLPVSVEQTGQHRQSFLRTYSSSPEMSDAPAGPPPGVVTCIGEPSRVHSAVVTVESMSSAGSVGISMVPFYRASFNRICYSLCMKPSLCGGCRRRSARISRPRPSSTTRLRRCRGEAVHGLPGIPGVEALLVGMNPGSPLVQTGIPFGEVVRS